jgi:hypothetical protein
VIAAVAAAAANPSAVHLMKDGYAPLDRPLAGKSCPLVTGCAQK